MNFKGKRCLVYGMGESGRSAIRLLSSLGAYVFFYDDDLSFLGQVGYVKNPCDQQFDYCIISPGVKLIDNEIYEKIKASKAKILSELDLGYLFLKGKIIAVTGTNGKTTVCMLLNHILKNAGYETILCGNIGVPLTSVCQKSNKNTITIVEVSSFQLEGSSIFSCDTAAVLNVQPDHIDRHHNFENYVASKEKLVQNAKNIVLNLDDDACKHMAVFGKTIFFSKNKIKKGAYIANGGIYFNRKRVLNIADIPLKGEKNLENVLAVCAILRKIDFNTLKNAILTFKPASHRLQEVAEIDGVTYVDDSKATNVSATLNAVSAYHKKSLILLVGGLGKDIPYDDLFLYQYKLIICFGENGKDIEKSALIHNRKTIYFKKFDDAVQYSIKNAEYGDVVLLSPACASFDEFESYRERGERFIELILENKK